MPVLVKYLAVGAINTLTTLLIIFLMLSAGKNVYLANAAGYTVGIGISFLLNCYFTFSVTVNCRRLFRFIVVCTLSYLINITTLHFFYACWPQYRYSGQVVAMLIYTLSGFLLNKFWGMR